MDGLRGLAIALVVVYHVWFGRVSGGVDIFLTLSGFFFVGSLLRAAESPAGVAPVQVVRRTLRRLMPALVLVLAAVAVMTVLTRPQTTWFGAAWETLASLTFWQNWELAQTGSDYLTAGADVSPLQHLWSISIQGQFYLAMLIVVAVLAWVLRRAGIAVRPVLAVVLSLGAAASMAYAVLAEHQQSWLYYDSAARAWELLLGAVMTCVAPWLRAPRVVRIVLAVAGLAVVIGAGAVLDGRADFPGPWALVPVGASLALILAGADGARAAGDNPVTEVLAAPRLVWLGTIAYALYLWHWPLLIGYLTVTEREEAGFLAGAVIIAISLVLAEMSTRWWENPIRLQTTRVAVRRSLTAVAAVLAVAVAGTGVAWIGHVDRTADALAWDDPVDVERYPGALALTAGYEAEPASHRPDLLVAGEDFPPTVEDECLVWPGDTSINTCEYGDPNGDRTLAVVGGSHAEHWVTALDEIGRRRGFRVVTIVKAMCPVMLPSGPEDPDDDCEAWTRNVVDELDRTRPDAVISTASRPVLGGDGDMVPGNYVAFWSALDRLGLPLIGIRDTPWILFQDGGKMDVPWCLSGGGDAIDCGRPRAEMLSPQNPIEQFLPMFPLMSTIDMSDAMCRPDWCRAIEGNVLIYRDADHITATYMRTMAPALDAELGRATGWW